MEQIDKLIDRHPVPTWRSIAWVVLALIAGACIWASLTEIDEFVVASGIVVPEGKVKQIQHLEGGIVEAIYVHEGERVRAGQRLVRLDLASSALNGPELQVRLDGLRIKEARLAAELDGVSLSLPADEAARQPGIAAAEQAAFESRKKELQSILGVLVKSIRQRKLEVAATHARLKSLKKEMVLATEQLSMKHKLAQDKWVSRAEVLKFEREVEHMRGEYEHLKVEHKRAAVALEEVRERHDQEITRFRSQTASERGLVVLEIQRQEELLSRASEQSNRNEAVSPIDGIVKNLAVSTIGGVVRAGQVIVEIVPIDDGLVIEAQLSPNDVGHVKAGFPAKVKLSTYDYLRYGSLEGTVRHIAADRSVDAQGLQYFKLIVDISDQILRAGGESYSIMPGMEAVIDVRSGTRSVLSYLMKPVLKLRNESFHER